MERAARRPRIPIKDVDEKLEAAHRIAERASKFEAQLNRNLVGRQDEADLITLALLLGKNAVLIGERGTAKSEITNRIGKLVDGRVFSMQLNRDTESSEVLGYFDPKVFKDEGRLVRNTDGTLLTADIAVLDEVFEANSILLNALRSSLLEKKFPDHGVYYDIKLWSAFGSSNMIPEDPRLDALYDRFLFRGFVQNMGQQGRMMELLQAGREMDLERVGNVDFKHEISIDDFKTFSGLVDQLGNHVLPLRLESGETGEVATKLMEAFHISDRRMMMIQKAVVASALLDGKSMADAGDLRVLRYLAPDTREKAGHVETVLRLLIPTDRRTKQDLQVAADAARNIIEPGVPVTREILDMISETIEQLRLYSRSHTAIPEIRAFAKTHLESIEKLLGESRKPEFEDLKTKFGLDGAKTNLAGAKRG